MIKAMTHIHLSVTQWDTVRQNQCDTHSFYFGQDFQSYTSSSELHINMEILLT